MPEYRRAYQNGGCYFLTLVCKDRQPLFAHDQNVRLLKTAMRHVKVRHTFTIDAVCVLPDHLHLMLSLPENDADFSGRIRLIKHYVSIHLGSSPWQSRFWEHLIRDEQDWHRHLDYIHYNPVKHGLVSAPADWRWSSFSHALAKGWYEPGWASTEPDSLKKMDLD